MAPGLSTYSANKLFDCIGNATTWTGVTNCYIQLHTGDPGSAGTSNVATETTRKAVSFAAATGGTITNDAVVEWTSISGSEDATYYTLWDASTSGNFLASGTITAPSYTAGDTYTIAVGDIDLALTVAS